MYSTSTASTTTSESRGVGAVTAPERRVRVVRLLRPRRAAPAFGFSLRGGKEYATGFFISKVDLNSEAHLQGLKIGDQVISVNGYRVDDAVHAELVHYITTQSRLKIKVRHVGMIPVKDKEQESLSWQFVSERASLTSDVSSSPTLCHNTDHLTDLRLSILVPPRAKLGCGICKGPDWKPGIFVQFVREGGIAREAGLRPGDQILSCNSQDFANVSFNEAITAMKACGRLELVVREGAGIELVSPESSGYNSSASSAAGERSPAPAAPAPLAPAAALRRRLASVAEEAADRADRWIFSRENLTTDLVKVVGTHRTNSEPIFNTGRLSSYMILMESSDPNNSHELTINRIKRRTWDSLDFEWKNDDIHNFDAPSDIEPDYDSPSIPNNPHTFENKAIMRCKPKLDYEPKVTSPLNRTIINLTEEGATIQCSYDNNSSNYNSKSQFIASQTNREKEKKTTVVEVHHTNIPPYAKPPISFPPPTKKESIADSTSISSSNTLTSAIAEEIQRRKLNKKKNEENDETIQTAVSKKVNVTKVIDNDQKKHHNALMDEFKKVHRKMFANHDPVSEMEKFRSSLDRQPTLPLRIDDHITTDITNGEKNLQKGDVGQKPPPPPPMPLTNGHQHVENTITEKQTIEKIETYLNKISNINKVSTLTRTPTPDYYNKTDLLGQLKSKNAKAENVEVDSLESYKLKTPTNVNPKPPSNYFCRAPNGTETMKKHARPVSVTIGQYVNNVGSRKEPSKLDFLNGDKTDGNGNIAETEPISSRLHNELALTLSRSNLRKKTEALGDGGR